MSVNYYEVLGVKSSATEGEIRDRFRKLARENHPDRYSGADKVDAERRFQILTEAVNVLTNPARRRQHDSEQAPGAPKAIEPAQIAKAYVREGVKAYNQRDFIGAHEKFDLAVKHNPEDAKAWHYVFLAASRLPTMTRQAVQAIETAIQKDPVNPLYLKDAGILCKKAGLASKAERYLESALQWDPENYEVQNALAELRQGRGEAGKGFTLFRKG